MRATRRWPVSRTIRSSRHGQVAPFQLSASSVTGEPSAATVVFDLDGRAGRLRVRAARHIGSIVDRLGCSASNPTDQVLWANYCEARRGSFLGSMYVTLQGPMLFSWTMLSSSEKA